MKPTVEALQRYPIELRKIDPEDGEGYIATIPVLGRFLFEGTGSTREEAVADLMDFAKEVLKEYRRRRLELPDPPRDDVEYSGRLLLRLPKYLHQRLSEESTRDQVSLNTYIISILSDSFRMPLVHRTLGEIQHCLVRLETELPVIKHIEADLGMGSVDILVGKKQTYVRAA